MTVTIGADLLTSYYQARAGLSGGLVSSSNTGLGNGLGGAASKIPTAPWATNSTAPQVSDLVDGVMHGKDFIDPKAAKLDAPGASPDYNALFSVYQAITALQGLTDQMNVKGISTARKADIQTRFNEGMAEVGAYLDKNPFTAFQLSQGTAAASQSNTGIKRETDTYSTMTLASGAPGAVVPAFQGDDVAFGMSVTRMSGTVVPISFDLNDMGSTPRTMANVTLYLNDKLAAAGVATRFAVQRTPGAERTTKAGDTTISLGTGPDTYALQLKGVSVETVAFTAPPEATPAVYVGEQVGATTPDRQLLKYETDPAGGATVATDGKVFGKSLGSEVQTVRASQTGPDGSLYVLADINGKTGDQTIKGTSDVALMKYDSAGNLVYTRTLGAAQAASGYALSVSDDGKKIAVAGSVTGALDSGDAGADPKLTDSFVAVFDSEGQQVWSQRSGAKADDQVTGVSFGDDGSLYVTGTASSAMTGAGAVGGQDSYIRGYKLNTASTATEAYSTKFTTQYGTTGIDKSAGVAVNGNTMVAAGVENGRIVVRRYDLQTTGAPVLGAVRDLGPVGGGTVAGVSFDDDGSVIIAGSTQNGDLDVGTVTNAYTSGQSAFVAKLSGDLTASSSEKLTYYNGTGGTGGVGGRSTTAVSVSGGKVYIAGQVGVTPLSGQKTAYDGYAAAIDPDTGAVTWTQSFKDADRQAAPTTIAVDDTGSSVLDRLGLPKGTIDYTGSQQIVANSSVRAGDQFYVRVGTGTAKAVTIEATDTLKTLAAKIGRAVGFTVKAEVVTDKGYDKIKITPQSSSQPVELEAGKTGRDALSALGLTEGLITSKADTNTKDMVKANYALLMPSNLNLNTDGGVKQASAQLLGALSVIKGIYRDMTNAPADVAKSGPVPAYLTAQIANYQAALDRLTGGG